MQCPSLHAEGLKVVCFHMSDSAVFVEACVVVCLSDSGSKLSYVPPDLFSFTFSSLSHCQIIITNWKGCEGKWSWYNLNVH